VTLFLWLRRAYQAVFLGLFLFLVVAATSQLIRGYPVHWFLGLDPLAATGSAIAARSLDPHFLWALPLVVLMLFLGRFFCGWICPMGALHHAAGWAARPLRIRLRVTDKNNPRPSRQVKYAVLAVFLGMAVLGSLQVGLLDPIASTWRALSTTVLPAASNTAFGLYQGERHFQWGTLVSAAFFGALALNLVYPRFYCRVLCPLGALLGVLSKFSLARIHRDPAKCKEGCKTCGADCQGAAEPYGKVKVAECMVCLNCIEACPRGALSYELLPPREASDESFDLARRRWIGAAVSGVVAVPLLRASDGVEPRPDPRRIRPPGALDEPGFLGRCLKCGACMKVCPTGGLQPAFTEAGLEGLWTPILVPRLGYCESGCVLCTTVCPSGAIRPLALEEKQGKPPEIEPVRIGSARFDKGRCLPWAYDTECIVCEEVCPTAKKAIYFKEQAVTARDGSPKTLKQPYVDLTLCTGCGTCEARCPVFDGPAVHVTSVGETRSAKNRIILTGGRV